MINEKNKLQSELGPISDKEGRETAFGVHKEDHDKIVSELDGEINDLKKTIRLEERFNVYNNDLDKNFQPVLKGAILRKQIFEKVRQNNTNFCFAFFDVDGLKAINDSVDYASGTKYLIKMMGILQIISQRINAAVENNYPELKGSVEINLSAQGGDEFGLMVSVKDDSYNIKDIRIDGKKIDETIYAMMREELQNCSLGEGEINMNDYAKKSREKEKNQGKLFMGKGLSPEKSDWDKLYEHYSAELQLIDELKQLLPDQAIIKFKKLLFESNLSIERLSISPDIYKTIGADLNACKSVALDGFDKADIEDNLRNEDFNKIFLRSLTILSALRNRQIEIDIEEFTFIPSMSMGALFFEDDPVISNKDDLVKYSEEVLKIILSDDLQGLALLGGDASDLREIINLCSAEKKEIKKKIGNDPVSDEVVCSAAIYSLRSKGILDFSNQSLARLAARFKRRDDVRKEKEDLRNSDPKSPNVVLEAKAATSVFIEDCAAAMKNNKMAMRNQMRSEGISFENYQLIIQEINSKFKNKEINEESANEMRAEAKKKYDTYRYLLLISRNDESARAEKAMRSADEERKKYKKLCEIQQQEIDVLAKFIDILKSSLSQAKDASRKAKIFTHSLKKKIKNFKEKPKENLSELMSLVEQFIQGTENYKEEMEKTAGLLNKYLRLHKESKS